MNELRERFTEALKSYNRRLEELQARRLRIEEEIKEYENLRDKVEATLEKLPK